jgi:hypothetical protein
MRHRSSSILAVGATAAVLLAGCGSEQATTTAQKASDQAKAQLTPQGRHLLTEAQDLVVRVTQTARGYAGDHLTATQASNRFEAERVEAQGLARDARGLPSTSRARDQLMRLTRQIRRSTANLRDSANGAKNGADAQDEVDSLTQAAKGAYAQLRSAVSPGLRRKVENLIAQLPA